MSLDQILARASIYFLNARRPFWSAVTGSIVVLAFNTHDLEKKWRVVNVQTEPGITAMIVTVIQKRLTKCTMSEAYSVDLLCKDELGNDCVVDPFITAVTTEHDSAAADSMIGRRFRLSGDFVCKGAHIPTAFDQVVSTANQQDLFAQIA